jgi:hypothetical protein
LFGTIRHRGQSARVDRSRFHNQRELRIGERHTRGDCMGEQEVRDAAGPSLRARFAVAIALTVAFYTLAIALALALLGVPVWTWIAIDRVNLWLTLFGVVAGFSILRSIVPARRRASRSTRRSSRGSRSSWRRSHAPPIRRRRQSRT